MASTLLEKRSETLAGLPEWQKLLEHFELAGDSFAYIPLLVQDDSWAEISEKNLTEYLSAKKKKLRKLAFTKPEDFKNLAGKLFDLKYTKTTGAIWITAPIVFRKEQIELWQEAWREATARLNQYRNPLREKFPVTFIFVGGFWTQEITRTMAPDLWSIRTTVVRIEPPAEEIAQDRQPTNIEALQRFEVGTNFDADYALKEAKRLRKKKGAEITAASLFYRAASGFLIYGRFQEAQKAIKEAIKIYRLNNPEKELADSLIVEGIILDNIGKFTDAIKKIEEAEEIYKRLELTDNLATAYVNKGNTLRKFNKFSESVIESDKAIVIYEELIKKKKQAELADELAMAYMNKGSALYYQDKLMDAEISYEKAIKIRERLVKEEKHVEFTDNLAKAYWGKGSVFVRLDRLNEAIDKYSEAIKLWDECLQRNELQILPNLSAVLYLRAKVLLMKEDWHLAAEDTRRALNLGKEVYAYPDFSEHFKTQILERCSDIIQLIREVSPEKREEIYKHAGEDSEMIRQFVEEFENNSQNA